MKLVDLRKKTGLSQAKFAAKFGIPLSTYFHWEQGSHKPPQYVITMITTMLEQENKTNELCQKDEENLIPVEWIEKQIADLGVKQHCYRQTHQGEEDEEINAIGSYLRGMVGTWQEKFQA